MFKVISFSVFMVLFVAIPCGAQNYWLEFKVNDSTKYYPINEIQKLYFSDVSNSELILHFIDSTNQSIPLSNIKDVQFSEDAALKVYSITLNFTDDSSTTFDFSTVDRIEIHSISSIGEEISFVNVTENYPNPFQTTTTIDFFLLTDCQLDIVIYDLFGNLIKRIDNSFYTRGKHSVVWHGDAEGGMDVNPGIYYCSLRSSKGAIINKMIKIR